MYQNEKVTFYRFRTVSKASNAAFFSGYITMTFYASKGLFQKFYSNCPKSNKSSKKGPCAPPNKLENTIYERLKV